MDVDSILANGIFYYPAWKHYGIERDVKCSLCRTVGLICCVGYQDMDLCMKCVDTSVLKVKPRGETPAVPKKSIPSDNRGEDNIACLPPYWIGPNPYGRPPDGGGRWGR
jgi:hypothetical protein